MNNAGVCKIGGTNDFGKRRTAAWNDEALIKFIDNTRNANPLSPRRKEVGEYSQMKCELESSQGEI